MHKPKLNIEIKETFNSQVDRAEPVQRFSLQGNQFCGSILIGNYRHLTHLEVCENKMEMLDLTCLPLLEKLKCSHNKLMELKVNGKKLMYFSSTYNYLHSIKVSTIPNNLTHLDISHNKFKIIPYWIGDCKYLQSLNVSNNQLESANALIQKYQILSLRILNIAHNHIRTLSVLPKNFESIEELYLQSNKLQYLPGNFFDIVHQNMRVLNLSSNKLINFPIKYVQSNLVILNFEKIILSNNQLDESIFEFLKHAKRLRILHVAYNKISELSNICVRNWLELEELVLSGNLLQHLPENISLLSNLRVLRVHSNLLLTTPILSKMPNLHVLDIAHNHLDRINLVKIIPMSLKCLDLSYNFQLQIDASQLEACQRKKKMSLVDVSGKNCSVLQIEKFGEYRRKDILKSTWSFGFSETMGICKKLSVCQIRNFRMHEAIFGLLESESEEINLPYISNKLVSQIFQKGLNNSSKEHIKFSVSSILQYIKENTKLSANSLNSITFCYIVKEHQWTKNYVKPRKIENYVLRVGSYGNIDAYLIKRTKYMHLTKKNFITSSNSYESNSLAFEVHTVEVALTNDDEYLIICNSNIWNNMDIDRIAREIRKEENVLLAAKRVQDIAQSFGVEGNISVLIIKICNLGSNVDCLIKELKQLARKNLPNSLSIPSDMNEVSTPPEKSNCPSPCEKYDMEINLLNIDNTDSKAHEETHSDILYNETESVLSEEQFKCWEYMLEQNTQLLFDKELNTISKAFKKNLTISDNSDFKSNLLKNGSKKAISTSSSHLLTCNNERKSISSSIPFQQDQQLTFISKYLGNSKVLQGNGTVGKNYIDSKDWTIESNNKLNGGPNAAYFGSLQRLMPYNTEYDFTITQERLILHKNNEDDEENEYNHEHESRIRKYWGVATTEL